MTAITVDSVAAIVYDVLDDFILGSDTRDGDMGIYVAQLDDHTIAAIQNYDEILGDMGSDVAIVASQSHFNGMPCYRILIWQSPDNVF